MTIRRDFSGIKEHFDLVIVGGGVTGSAVAREAAVRGLKTLLLEKNDFGHATSAATSKLLHGGLRYLESYEFGLVRESLAERHIMGLAAGHLSRPMPFVVPMYAWSNPGRFTLQAGLTIYDLLAYDRNLGTPEDKQMPGAKWISREEVLRIEPRIESRELKGGFLYYDYQNLFPERLNLAFLKTAVKHGATLLNHCRVTGFEMETAGGAKRVKSVCFKDELAGQEWTASGTVFVNASGPWMDLLLGLVQTNPAHKVQRSKGIHLLTDRIVGDHTVFLRNRKGQHCLVIPWEGMTLIGPTDTPYSGHPDDLRPLEEDIQPLISLVNELLPGAPLTRDKIRHVPIGIRPLVFSDRSTYKASRKYEIYDHSAEADRVEGLLSVVGGKWTTSRRLGESVMDRVLPKLHKLDSGSERRVKSVRTDRDALAGFPSFGASASELWEQVALTHHRIPDTILNHLFTLYGTEFQEILEIGRKDPDMMKRLSDAPGRFDIMAQIQFAVEHESAQTLTDILSRRLAIGSFGYPGDAVTERAAALAARLHRWSSKRKAEEIASFKKTFPLELLSGK